jgi:hypothetical protein
MIPSAKRIEADRVKRGDLAVEKKGELYQPGYGPAPGMAAGGGGVGPTTFAGTEGPGAAGAVREAPPNIIQT